jgi:hypothetical protein
MSRPRRAWTLSQEIEALQEGETFWSGGDAGGRGRRSLSSTTGERERKTRVVGGQPAGSNGLAERRLGPCRISRLPEQHPFGVAGDHADGRKTIAVLSSTA